MQISLKKLVSPGLPLAILYILIAIIMWVPVLLGYSLRSANGESAMQLNKLAAGWGLDEIVFRVLAFLLTFFNTYLLAQMNNRFTIIRTRTFMPVFVFLLMIGCLVSFRVELVSMLILTVISASLFCFFSMSRNRQASEQAFLGTFLLALVSIVYHPFLFLIPVCTLGFSFLQSFSLRTFLASVFGTAVPWIFFLVFRFYSQGLPGIKSLLLDLYPAIDPDIHHYPPLDIIYFGFMFLLLMFSVVGVKTLENTDSIHTRNKLNFLILFLLTLCVLALVYQQQYLIILPAMILTFALILSHPFTLIQNMVYSIVFLVFVFASISYGVYCQVK